MMGGPTGSTRWRFASVLTLFVLAACGDAGDGGARAGGTAIAGVRTDFDGFNPVTSSSQYSIELNNYALFTPIIQYDENLEPEPWLAESWEMHGDSGVTFTLRQDVRWHDGQPVTAEDVKFTFDLAKDEAAASLLASAYLSHVDSAEVVAPNQIRFHFSSPHAQALEDFWWAPLPKHVLEGTSAGELRNAPFNRSPVGSGPYRFGEWTANQRLVLTRNEEFPEALGGPPAPERVVFRIVPEPATLLTELLTGGVHVDIDLQPDQAAQVEQRGELELHAVPGKTLYYLGWNNQRAPFTDAAVRRALTHAINRGEIVDALLKGYGQVATSTVPPWHPYYPDDVEPLGYDPDQARRLLEQAGWVDRDNDGVRENEAGRPLRFQLLTSERPLNRSIVEVVQSQLRQVGAEARLQVLEFQTMLSQHRGRDFDAVLSNWVLDNFKMASTPEALFHSRNAAVEGSANRSGVRSQALDRLIERGARATETDEASRVWAEFTRALQEEQPFTLMFWLQELAASSERIDGVEMDARGELVSIPDWSVQ